VVFVSATPGPYEMSRSQGVVVEQIIRPTGLIDPPIEVRPVKGQVDDLLQEIRARVIQRERVLVTTLTKRMAEDLTQYYQELGVRVRYLHSDIETLERIRSSAIYDAASSTCWWGSTCSGRGSTCRSVAGGDSRRRQGRLLRSAGSLIQTSGRAARNVNGRVIMYAEIVTASMRHAIGETERRRALQEAYNHGARHHAAVHRQGDRRGHVERL